MSDKNLERNHVDLRDRLGQPVSSGFGDGLSSFVRYFFTSPHSRRKIAWRKIGLERNIVALEVASDGTLYAGAFYNREGLGIFKSSDQKNWNAVNNGLDELCIQQIDVNPTDPETIVARVDSRIWFSDNGGKAWTPLDGDPWGSGLRFSGDGKILLASKWYSGDDRGLYMMDMTASTKTWVSVEEAGDLEKDMERRRNYSLIFRAGDSTFYGVTVSGQGIYGVADRSRLFRSDDSGRSWQRLAGIRDDHILYSLCAEAKDDQVVYAGTIRSKDRTGSGIYKSINGGGSWFPVNNTLPNQGRGVLVHSLICHPTQEDVIYAAISRKDSYGQTRSVYIEDICKTTNGGESWVEMRRGLPRVFPDKYPYIPNINELAISPEGSTLYAATKKGVLAYDLPR